MSNLNKKISLNGTWSLYYWNDKIRNSDSKLPQGKKIEAIVPGNVEIDLLNDGIINDDLFKGMSTDENRWIEDFDWWYEREFVIKTDFKRAFLSFGAVDCIAEYYLNGEKVFESNNAFTEIKFEITDKVILNSKNIIAVHIKSAAKEAFKKQYNLYLSASRPGYQNYLRKPAHSFGWDIFPRAISAGLWRDVNLILDDGIVFEECSYFVESANKTKAKIHFQASICAPYTEFKKKVCVRVTGKCYDSEFQFLIDMYHFKSGRIDNAVVINPYLWWPSGYGESNIYDLKFELLIDDIVCDVKQMNMGIRTVELKHTNTLVEKNHCFAFIVNGIEIMCKGSNWVPLDVYHSRDKEKYKRALSLFTDTYCNILRVWGGGVYESEDFYDYCDRHGIMIWQDFMMACFPVSQDEETIKNIKNEVEWAVKTLRNHPSIIIWSGDNEIDECLATHTFKTDVNKITREVIPNIISQNDSLRPYISSSPYIDSDISDKYSTSVVCPEMHLWGARDYFKSKYYKCSNAHFISEIGYHGCPCLESIKKTVDEDYIWPIFNEQWILHSSDQNGNNSRVLLMWEQIKQLFGFEPQNIDDFITASQIAQAEAKKYFIERSRINRPYTTGIIWWNMLDGWPQMSDAVVDYFFEKKLAYSYIKRSQTPISLMFDELSDWNYKLYAVNDTLQDAKGEYEVINIDTDEVLLRGTFSSEANKSTEINKLKVMYSDKKFLAIKWTNDGKTYYNHYLCGMPPFDFKTYCRWIKKFESYQKQ